MVTKVLKQVPSGQKPDRMVLKAKAPARRRLENLNVFVCNFYIYPNGSITKHIQL